MGTKMAKRIYTDEEKHAAIERSREIGPVQAAKELGFPSGSLTCWAYKARQAEAAAAPANPGKGRAGGGVPASSAPKDGKTVAALPGPPPLRGERSSISRVARMYTPSEKARALEVVAARGVAAAHRELGISEFSLKEWRRRAWRAAAGEGLAPTSGPAPADIEARRDGEILKELHEHPGLGSSQIRNQLRRAGIKVATHPARRVMEGAEGR